MTATLAYRAPKTALPVARISTLVVLQRGGQHSVNVASGRVGQVTVRVTTGALEIAIENAPGLASGGGYASCQTRNGRPARPKHSSKPQKKLATLAPVLGHVADTGGFIWPATGFIANTAAMHKATEGQYAEDIASHVPGETVVAAASGDVVSSFSNLTTPNCRFAPGHRGGLGNVVVLRHGSGSAQYYTLYGHLDHSVVTAGQKVSQGQPIGVMGSTGCSTGTHTHFEIGTCLTGLAGQQLIAAGCTMWGTDPNVPGLNSSIAQGSPVPGSYPGFAAPPPPGAEWNGWIVQWDGDRKAQKTAWLVVPNAFSPGHYVRWWIPDIQTYWCLKKNGAPGPKALDAHTLSTELPDQTGLAVVCDTHQAPTGSGGGSPSGISEQAGHYGAATFGDYHTASGAGPRVGAGQYVQVGCKVRDGHVASSNPDGYWYQLVGEPWDGRYWAPANVFMNGDPWGGPYSHNTDFNVPDCGSGSNAGPVGGVTSTVTLIGTVLEQQGHHGSATFSNYHSASGQGPSVQAGQYVHVACKVLDGTIASTRPDGYWYQLADPPWNGVYYAPATTFMNGDPWAGPYSHNTDFNVPDCGQAPVTKSGAPSSGPPSGESTFAEHEGHNGVHTFSNYHNASGAGPNIGAGAVVHVSCKVLDGAIASTNPDGYWYRIADAPWSDGYYAPANTFMNGDPWNGPYTHNTDLNVPNCSDASPTTPPPPPSTPGTSAETVGGVTHTWTNYTNAGGTQGPSIQTGQTVQVACKVPGFRVQDGDTWWYKIASSPWNSAYYASADAFYNNGQTAGSLVGTPFVDNNVPDCAGGGPNPPPPPPTWAETVGGVTHTWTNYTNAGGTQGPSIQTGQTVQVACKVPGFRVQDGDTWWYKIASSPWNSAYYASADAFYNNGQTSGSLHGTPFVDNAVADC